MVFLCHFDVNVYQRLYPNLRLSSPFKYRKENHPAPTSKVFPLIFRPSIPAPGLDVSPPDGRQQNDVNDWVSPATARPVGRLASASSVWPADPLGVGPMGASCFSQPPSSWNVGNLEITRAKWWRKHRITTWKPNYNLVLHGSASFYQSSNFCGVINSFESRPDAMKIVQTTLQMSSGKSSKPETAPSNQWLAIEFWWILYKQHA